MPETVVGLYLVAFGTLQTAAFLVRPALETGELRAPRDGPIDYTAIPDLAAATAIILASEDLDDTILTSRAPRLSTQPGSRPLPQRLQTGRWRESSSRVTSIGLV